MKKILIIEDDLYIRDIYNVSFIKAGYDVSLASDGEMGVDILKSKQFDIILLDIMMPKMTGIDVLKIVRDVSFPAHDVPIFLITNLGQNDIIEQAFKLGADGYILKSQLTPGEIVREIDTFFEKKK